MLSALLLLPTLALAECEDHAGHFVALSPDGERLAWLDGASLCVSRWREGSTQARALEAAPEARRVQWGGDAHVLMRSDAARWARVPLDPEAEVQVEVGDLVALARDDSVVLTRSEGEGVAFLRWPVGGVAEVYARHPHPHDRWILDVESLEPVGAQDRSLYQHDLRRLDTEGDVVLDTRSYESSPARQGWLRADPWARDGQALVVDEAGGLDSVALVDLESGEQGVVFQGEGPLLEKVLLRPGSFEPLAVEYAGMKPRWAALDPELLDDVRFLNAQPLTFFLLGRSRDDRVWLLNATSPAQPTRQVLFDRDKLALREVGWVAEVEPTLGARAELLRFDARDGFPLEASLLLPPAGEAPPPVVVRIHGGPWPGRDGWWYEQEDHRLAKQGYATLRVNFRGSYGQGLETQRASDGEWGDALQTDVLDALAHVVERGLVDAERVAFVGASFGGYSVLRILTRYPDAGACGIATHAPASLVTRHRSELGLHLYIGDLAQRLDWSPDRHVEALEVPLLMLHGHEDDNVRPRYARPFARRALRAGKPVTYLEFADVGHGFGRAQQAWPAALEDAFLAGCLGGAPAPIGDALRDAELTRRLGVAHFPGLAEALP